MGLNNLFICYKNIAQKLFIEKNKKQQKNHDNDNFTDEKENESDDKNWKQMYLSLKKKYDELLIQNTKLLTQTQQKQFFNQFK